MWTISGKRALNLRRSLSSFPSSSPPYCPTKACDRSCPGAMCSFQRPYHSSICHRTRHQHSGKGTFFGGHCCTQHLTTTATTTISPDSYERRKYPCPHSKILQATEESVKVPLSTFRSTIDNRRFRGGRAEVFASTTLFHRSFSSGRGTQKDQSKKAADKLKTSNEGKSKVAVESDFIEHLSGDMKHPVESTTRGNKVKKLRQQRRVARSIVLDHDKELYKQIDRIQTIQKEQARIRTATNVYRALCGNVIICVAKLGAWASSGSSSMLAEFVHSVVDCGNQALLLVGLGTSRMDADRKHPYGYGKNVYFWALVSALGTFFLGAGVSMTHAVADLSEPALQEITWHVWGVLAISFIVDGYVLSRTIAETWESKPRNVPYLKHLSNIRDPATLAVLLEDGAACLGILIAVSGITASHVTGNPIFDGLAGVGISALLGVMGLALVRINHRFLLGQGVDRDIVDGIEKILLSRRSIDSIGSVQSQWTGPDTFSYKAEVDFDGTYLAAKLMPIYQHEFLQIRDTMDEELQVLLALYAEDVMRTVEREVRHVEAQIRKRYPGAEFIELEPMSVDADRLAIDDNLEAELRRVESDALNRYLKTLRKESSTVEQQMKEQNTSPKDIPAK